MSTEAGHEHEFDPAPIGTIAMCVDRTCTEMRLFTKDGWVELTSTERTEATILMWEDLILVQAMQIIHGKETGLARFRYLRHGGPPA